MKKICIVLIHLFAMIILIGCSASIDNQPAESETISMNKEATESSIPIPIVIAAKLEDLRTAEREASIPIPVVIAQSLNDLSESEALYGH